MANKTCAQLIARIKELVGRSRTTDTGIDVSTIILDALNEAQRRIVMAVPGIVNLHVKSTTSHITVLNEYSVALMAPEYFSPIVGPPSLSYVPLSPAHIRNVWILDGTSTWKLEFLPTDEFDERYPSVASETSGRPTKWTRRGGAIEFNCPIGEGYEGKYIRIDYCKWAADFTSTTSTAVSELPMSDKGLIYSAWAETLRAIVKDNPNLAMEKEGWFQEWLNEYEDYFDTQMEG